MQFLGFIHFQCEVNRKIPKLVQTIIYFVSDITVICDTELDIVQCEGIQLSGLDFSKTAKKNYVHPDPILETYQFVYYDESEEDVIYNKTSLIISLEIILQNRKEQVRNLRICELTNVTSESLLLTNVKNILERKPLVTVEHVPWEQNNIIIKYDLMVLEESNLRQINNITTIGNYLFDGGFVLYQGSYDQIEKMNLDIVFKFSNSANTIYLLRQSQEFPKTFSIVNVSNTDFCWIEKLKFHLGNVEHEVIYLVSQNNNTSGIVGLTNCLMKESSTKEFRFIFIEDNFENFSVENNFFRSQLKKNLVFNILRNKRWGTFVHIPLESSDTKVTNAEVSITTIGDFSTLKWIESAPYRVR